MDQKDKDPLSSIRTEGGMLQQGNGRKDIADHSGTEALRKERTVDTTTPGHWCWSWSRWVSLMTTVSKCGKKEILQLNDRFLLAVKLIPVDLRASSGNLNYWDSSQGRVEPVRSYSNYNHFVNNWLRRPIDLTTSPSQHSLGIECRMSKLQKYEASFLFKMSTIENLSLGSFEVAGKVNSISTQCSWLAEAAAKIWYSLLVIGPHWTLNMENPLSSELWAFASYCISIWEGGAAVECQWPSSLSSVNYQTSAFNYYWDSNK